MSSEPAGTLRNARQSLFGKQKQAQGIESNIGGVARVNELSFAFRMRLRYEFDLGPWSFRDFAIFGVRCGFDHASSKRPAFE